jgi:hypothetical protein
MAEEAVYPIARKGKRDKNWLGLNIYYRARLP